MKKLKAISRIVITLSALLMISAYYVPIWQILMWAPQYPEGLEMKIWIDNITGDVKIISALNHYIGMKHIDVSMFPEFKYMIYIVAALIGIGLLTAIINRRFMLLAYALLIIASGAAALIDFYLWGYDYGHNLDPTAPIIVPGMSYQPPVIGTKQLLNFTAFSGPDAGGWIFLAIGLTVIATLLFELNAFRRKKKSIVNVIFAIAIASGACSTKPEPLVYGDDACHTCKMTLMDNRFGGEIVTQKGKIYKFDDVNCLVNFISTENISHENMAHVLIVDFAMPGELIDAKNAFYIKSPHIKSPMVSNIAAFGNDGELKKHNKEWEGIVLTWGELVTEYK